MGAGVALRNLDFPDPTAFLQTVYNLREPTLLIDHHRGDLILLNDNFVQGEKVSKLFFMLTAIKAVTQQ